MQLCDKLLEQPLVSRSAGQVGVLIRVRKMIVQLTRAKLPAGIVNRNEQRVGRSTDRRRCGTTNQQGNEDPPGYLASLQERARNNAIVALAIQRRHAVTIPGTAHG